MEEYTSCPNCNRDYDEIDYDYQSCSKCGWDAEKGNNTGYVRRPSEQDYLNGEADILTGEFN